MWPLLVEGTRRETEEAELNCRRRVVPLSSHRSSKSSTPGSESSPLTTSSPSLSRPFSRSPPSTAPNSPPSASSLLPSFSSPKGPIPPSKSCPKPTPSTSSLSTGASLPRRPKLSLGEGWPCRETRIRCVCSEERTQSRRR